jgi:two-component system KDP operon response regulator KdpE
MTDTPVVLIVEDEAPTRALLQITLRRESYRCIHASTGQEGVAAAIEREPAVVLLDLGLPDLDGVEVTRRIRERSRVPIIVVSARGQEEHKIAALDGGANDYVTKPFVAGELLARVRVALRGRTPGEDAQEPTGQVTIGGLTVDFDMRLVTVHGVEVSMTPTEYRLLGMFMRSAGRVLTHRQILKHVWGAGYEGQVGSLRVYMKRLRYKIEREPAQPKYLESVPGVGYRLRVPA